MYGTSFTAVHQVTSTGKCCILDIDVQGVKQLSEKKELNALVIAIVPKSLQELEKRLRARGTETEDSISVRVKNASTELSFLEQHAALVHTTVVNDELETCYQHVLQLLQAQDLV